MEPRGISCGKGVTGGTQGMRRKRKKVQGVRNDTEGEGKAWRAVMREVMRKDMI